MTAKLELAYLGFEVSNIPAWDNLLTEVIGLLGNGTNSDGSYSYRMDGFSQRIFLTKGPADDIAVVGFSVADELEFDALISRLDKAKVHRDECSAEDAENRHVSRLVRISDPYGNVIEFCQRQQFAATPFRSAVAPAGFVTGDMGMGHIVFVVPELQKALKFYTEVLGLRVADTGSERWGEIHAQIAFLHSNRRHHSLALASGIPPVKRALHFQVHAPSIDDVGHAWDRARKAGIEITRELGRHPDGVFSFYAKTPSGFEWEVGTDGHLVDDSWTAKHFTRFSVWGHQPPQST